MLLALQLGLLLLVIRDFELVSPAFYNIAILAFAGSLVHHFLPFRFRLSFFFILSLASIGIILGFKEGVWLVGIGLILIGICHLPIRFAARVAILILAGIALALFRANWFHAPLSGALWPILGSMFMFRLIIYLYDLSHDDAPVSIPRTLSYFFLLPNVCFPLFPVIDFKTFRRTYFDDEPYRIYQTGVFWMFRGITHLIAYRLVYYYFSLAPSEVDKAGDLIQYLISSYLLILRVSGHFHMIVGMLHLFGFNLPETQHLYYLASSFTDLWRRANIYWKDFMVKVFYYPAYFLVRRWETRNRLIFSTFAVFIATWLLHSYQWFWIRGSFLFTWNDLIFWAILGALVLANSLYETRHGRERRLRESSWTLRAGLGLSLRTAGTFATMCILFSLLSSASMTEWLGLWSVVGESPAVNTISVPAVLVAAVSLGAARRSETGTEGIPDKHQEGMLQKSIIITCGLLLLYLIGNPAVLSLLGSKAAQVIDPLRKERLSERDEALIESGYYQNLTSVDRFNTQLWERYSKPADWRPLGKTRAVRGLRGDFLEHELAPSVEVPFHGAILKTNR